MLILLPVLVIAAGMYLFRHAANPGEGIYDYRRSFIFTVVFTGAFISISSEILSLFSVLNRTWVALIWAFALLVLIWQLRRNHEHIDLKSLQAAWSAQDLFTKIIFTCIGLVISLLFLIAVISPPNNVDSFIYHMSRVVHWAQDQSLRHYPAYIGHQLNKPIWSETFILQLRLLWGSDRVANLMQWFCMVASVVGVSAIARLLGLSKKAQILSSLFALSIPMGILQSTSTQNDYATSLWAVMLAYFVLLSMKRELTRIELVCLATSFGLGVLTKGTFFVYFPPFIVWYLLHRIWKAGFANAIKQGVLLAVVVFVLNLGFWVRNIQTYGGPYGSSEWLQKNLGFDVDFFNRIFDKDQSSGLNSNEDSYPLSSADFSRENLPIVVNIDLRRGANVVGESLASESRALAWIRDYLNRLAMTAGRNFTSPSGFVTQQLIKFVDTFPQVFGESYGDELQASAWNHEDHAGNLHHLLLILAALPIVFVLSLRKKDPVILYYSGSVLLTFCLIPVVIGHGQGFWGVRYQLPFFVLASPLLASAVGAFRNKYIYPMLVIFLLAASLPWLLLNSTRPVIGMPPWPTKIGSIFAESQERILFANNQGLLDDYSLAASAINQSGCDSVGLLVNTEFLEYPLWWLLDAPQSGTWIEVIVGEGESLSVYRSGRAYCAVICNECSQSAEESGFQDRQVFDTLTLFQNELDEK